MSTGTKRSSSGGDEQQPKQLRSSDVVVVVGETEFQENSHFLRSVSDFFDGALRSGWKESVEKRFEFPDKRPKDWELVKELLSPLSSKKISMENIRRLLPWFDELLISKGLEECDQILHERILERYKSCYGAEPKGSELDDFLRYFQMSNKYNLKKSQEACIDKVVSLFEKYPTRLGVDHLQKIPSLLAVVDEETRKRIWNFLNEYIPKNITPLKREEQDAFIEKNGDNLLPHLLYSNIQLKDAKDQLEDAKELFGTLKGQLQSSELFQSVRPRYRY